MFSPPPELWTDLARCRVVRSNCVSGCLAGTCHVDRPGPGVGLAFFSHRDRCRVAFWGAQYSPWGFPWMVQVSRFPVRRRTALPRTPL